MAIARGRKMLWGAMLTLLLPGFGVLGRQGIWWVVGPIAVEAETPPLVAPTNGGALFIHGGGRVADDLRRKFVGLIGGPDRARLVVVPTASDYADRSDADSYYLDLWRRLGVKEVRLLHTHDRSQADDPDFARPIEEANAVWFSGGRQSRLADNYVGTEVERQLRALLQRGGVVGGTSAGAAIMTGLMILEGRTEAVTGQGFDLLPGAVVDQHFLRRNRLGRLNQVLATHPGHIGFGIDEATALIVVGKQLIAVGESYVVCCVPSAGDRPACTIVLKPGDRTDLDSLRAATPIISSPATLNELLADDD